jgi:predicted AlkP superfamily pyrophosphatase or phosphodiesterase
MYINDTSVSAIERSSLSSKFVRPLYESYCFGSIPAFIQQRLCGEALSRALPEDVCQGFSAEYDAVVLVFCDALGWKFTEAMHRDGAVPSFTRFSEGTRCSALTSLFPSTTAVHVTGIHSGLTASQTGIFEWHYYEGRVGEIVTPLPFRYTHALKDEMGEKRTLKGDGTTADAFIPRSAIYPWLSERGVTSYIHQPAMHLESPYNHQLLGADVTLVPISGFQSGLTDLAEAVKREKGRSYHYYYHDGLDSAGHHHGPEGAEYVNAARYFFDNFEKYFLSEMRECHKNVLLVLTADHGQVLSPAEEIVYLDRECPSLQSLIRTTHSGNPLAPVGSVRDFFVYPREGSEQEVFDRLTDLVGDKGVVCWTQKLREQGMFGVVESEHLRNNLGEICILAFEGEGFYWAGEKGEFVTQYHGHHGGLTDKEALVPFILKEL